MNKERTVINEKPAINPRFVLLLGPSGAGKSSIIQEIQNRDTRIKFVAPITDRPNRSGEKEKVSVTPEEFSHLEQQDTFLIVNNMYGYRYGTPRFAITDVIRNGGIPILDFPLNRVDALSDQYRNLLFNIYIVPPTLGTLHSRLKNDARDQRNSRYNEGKEELLNLVKNHFKHSNIHAVVINKDLQNSVAKVLALINKIVN